MTTAALALVAALAALLAAGAVAVLVLRTRHASERRLNQGLLVIGEQMEALAGELAATVEKVREDALRARLVESFGQALDLDEVLARCAEAAASLHGVAGSTIAVEVDGVPLFASAGLGIAPPATGAGSVGGPPDGSRVRAVAISYHYATGGSESPALRSAIAVPFESESGRLGFLTVYGAGEDPPVAGSDFQTLEAIVRHAGPAIEAASRRGALRRLPDVDGLTGLGNRQALHETLALEVARAHRHGRRLAICVLDLDDFKRANSRVGQVAGDGMLTGVAELLREAAGPSGLAFRSGGDEFAVILPESGRIDAEALFARLQATLHRPGSSGPSPSLSLSAGIAELKPGDDGVSLFERAERALHRAKESGKGTAA
jgi:diguanylate cyclase (GGDEF)-like protein